MTSATVTSNRSAMGRFAVFAACLLAGTLGVAQAATPVSEVPAIVVSYSDLDLSTADGINTLYKRIAIAAREVCPFANDMQPARIAFAHACRAAAIDRAVSTVHSPQLVALRVEHAKRG